jgi:hypothetical protein
MSEWHFGGFSAGHYQWAVHGLTMQRDVLGQPFPNAVGKF